MQRRKTDKVRLDFLIENRYSLTDTSSSPFEWDQRWSVGSLAKDVIWRGRSARDAIDRAMSEPPDKRGVPQWVVDHVANPHTDYQPHGSGYVLMRDGAVIDRWPD